jgi:hypothetical protein
VRVGKTKRLRTSALRSARARFRAIEPLLKFRWGMVRENLILLNQSGTEIVTKTELLLSRAAEVGISSATLARWLSRFCDFGFAGLRASRRSDRGLPRALRGNFAALVLLNCEAAAGTPSSEIHRTLKLEWPRIGDGKRPPSYRTVCRFVAQRRAWLSASETLP